MFLMQAKTYLISINEIWWDKIHEEECEDWKA